MAELVVKVKPDTKELDKELKKKRTFSGLLGFGGVGGNQAGEDSTSGIPGGKKSTKSIAKMAGSLAAILSVLDAANFIVKPIMALLKAVITLLLLPLIPILIPTLKIMAKSIPLLAEIMGNVRDFMQKIVDIIGTGISWVWENILQPIVKGTLDAFTEFFAIAGTIILETVKKGFEIILTIGEFLFNLTVKSFKVLLKIGRFLFDRISNGFRFLFNIGEKVWEKFVKPGFSFLSDSGEKLWDLIKKPFELFKTLFQNAISGITSFINNLIPGSRFDIPELANGGIVTRPTLAVIGEKGPEAVIPLNGGSTGAGMTFSPTIHINASINSQMDVRRLGEDIARIGAEALSRRTNSLRF